MDKLRKIFFDEASHKYTDEYSNTYTSMTTVIGDYYEKFGEKQEEIARACERIGKKPSHPKYEKYKDKSAKQLLYEWSESARIACDKGNNRHNYLEDIINVANSFVLSTKKYSGKRIYTIQDVVEDHDFGRIDFDYFEKSGLKDRYPAIYNLIAQLHNAGFYFYAEIGVFDPDRLISGLIDLLCIHHDKKLFIILDWKTNKSKIVFESGYYDKDRNGNETGNFIHTNSVFKAPLDHLPDSTGHKYSMQVSGYAVLVSLYGYTNLTNMICHIREDEDGNEIVEVVKTLDLSNDANLMFNDHFYNRNLKTQGRIF